MKKLILIACILFSVILNAQITCEVDFTNGPEIVGDDPTTIFYIPDNYTTTKVIKVNFHFMLKQTGDPLNFTETDDGNGDPSFTGYDFADEIIAIAKQRLLSNEQMNLPQGNTTSALFRAYTVELAGVYFHRSDIHYTSQTSLSTLMTNYGVNLGTEVNVFWVYDEDIPYAGGGEANMTGNRAIKSKAAWQTYIDYGTAGFWGNSWTFLHELGHNLGLHHTVRYDSGPCGNIDDYCSDTPYRQDLIDTGEPDPCCGWGNGNTPTCSNNMMDYSGKIALTPEQLGRIHYTIVNEMVDYLDESYCNINTNSLPHIIPNGSNIVWQNSRILENDLIIENGAELLIKDCSIHMPANSRIIVKPNGKLTIDNSVITNFCDKPWEGIEVWGNKNLAQNPLYQGWLEITNGGTIENAVTAVLLDNSIPSAGPIGYTGGILHASNAIFKNNINSVVFNSYSQFSVSLITSCQFIIDENWLHQNKKPEAHITLSDYKGLNIKGCSFINEATNLFETQNSGKGILSINSNFIVDYKCLSGSVPCDRIQPTTFTDLYYGVYAVSKGSEQTYTVQNSEFDCYRGIYNGAINNSTIVLNKFTVPPALIGNESYGLYLDYSTGYQVEGNEFEGNNPNLNIGLYVNNSGTGDNLIYNNTFNNLSTASAYQDINRDDITGGLEVKCNDYTNNSTDVLVVVEDPLQNNADYGIAQAQGYLDILNPTDPTAPAGNTFSDFSGHTWDIYNEGNGINYVFHSISSTTSKVEPILNFGIVSTFQSTLALYDKEDACPPTFGSGGGIEEIKGRIALAENSAEVVSAELLTLTDGGDTEELTFDLATAMPGEEIETRDMLLIESPDLSDTVMIATIEKEEVLPNAMVRDVLIQNPQAAKSKKVQDALDQRNSQMPQYMRNQIDQGRYTLSPKELLESEKAYYNMEKALAFKQLHYLYRTDSTIVNASDSLAQLYAENGSLDNQYRLAMLKLSNGDTVQPFDILSNIPDNFELSNTQENERQSFNSYFKIIKQMKRDELQKPDSSAINNLQSLYQNGIGMPTVYARNILLMVNELTYNEPILLPDTTFKNSSVSNISLIDQEQTSNSLLVLKPNPASDYVITQWELPETAKDPHLYISDINGRFIEKIEINGLKNEKVISIAKYKPGTYIVSLVSDGIKYDSKKLSIVK
ncbi:MAG: T9SS type A sorting domain-containing protein [Chlorobi bacterium]|nr:T9SS type A sorting domain-containing protein [Chlorobiota bacterium]